MASTSMDKYLDPALATSEPLSDKNVPSLLPPYCGAETITS
jgi:hypothetical protein